MSIQEQGWLRAQHRVPLHGVSMRALYWVSNRFTINASNCHDGWARRLLCVTVGPTRGRGFWGCFGYDPGAVPRGRGGRLREARPVASAPTGTDAKRFILARSGPSVSQTQTPSAVPIVSCVPSEVIQRRPKRSNVALPSLLFASTAVFFVFRPRRVRISPSGTQYWYDLEYHV